MIQYMENVRIKPPNSAKLSLTRSQFGNGTRGCDSRTAFFLPRTVRLQVIQRHLQGGFEQIFNNSATYTLPAGYLQEMARIIAMIVAAA